MKRNITTLVLALVLILGLFGTVSLLLRATPEEENTTQPSQQTQLQNLVFSEICTKNETLIPDTSGKYPDYVELYNAGADLDLSTIRISDGKVISQPLTGRVIHSGEYLLLFLSDATTGFALGASGGDQLQLLDPQGNILLQVTTMPMTENQVMVYQNGSYVVSTEASPGFPNDEEGVAMFRYGAEDTAPKLVISEVMIDNDYTLPDENLAYADVLELHNISDQPVQLQDYYLSDSWESHYDYRLPERELLPGEYVLIWCDGGNYVSQDHVIHTDFRISHGETLYLSTLDHYYTRVTAHACGDGKSLSRQADGSYTAGPVSLGFANDQSGIALFQQSRTNLEAPLVINEILLSSGNVSYMGAFCDVVEIYNRSDEPVSTAGWYLTDREDPFAYALPEQTLMPGGYLVILCGPDTTGFSLSNLDALMLTGPDHLHSIPVTCATGNVSRQETDGQITYLSMGTTLGYANTQENHLQYLRDQYGGGLMISELMSSNQSYLPGPYATTCDWIELYNSSTESIELSHYYLTDNEDYLQRYPLPEKTLKPGQYCVIFLSETGKNLLSGYSVLPFNLSSAGETLYLSGPDGITDWVDLPPMQADTSYGRPTGSMEYVLLAEVTPGKANSAAAQITQTPTAALPQGIYNDVQWLDIAFAGEGTIYYTTDCTIPTRDSAVYSGPIRITETTVFRLFCVSDGKQPSKVLDLTYLINEKDTLSVVTLVTEPDNLWDWENGIYVLGPNASPNRPYLGANFWMDWEIPATVSLFDTNGSGFTAGCGVKIFGGYSRYEDKKSLACFFRSRYGTSELDYALYGEAGPDTFEAFVLRSGGQDVFWSRMRDVLVTSLASEYLSLPVQKYKPVVVYLNGEYFGLHYIREKLNTHYIAGNFNVSAEDAVLCECQGTNSREYLALVRYAMNHDLSQQEHFDYICSQIDVENYMDFMITQIWIGNTDNSNVRFFKTTGGKWKWILYDTDFSLYRSDFDSVSDHLNPNAIGSKDYTSKTLLVRLLKNPEFRERFLRRMAWQMNQVWTVENISARTAYFQGLIEEDMVKDCQRWNRSYSKWLTNVENLNVFARERNDYLLDYIQDFFDLTDGQMAEYGFPTA